MSSNSGESRQHPKGFYGRIETIGNKIPNPMIFFVWFCIIIIVSSWLFSIIGLSAVNPSTGEKAEVYNLLSRSGIARMLTSMVSNFQSLSVLGPVLTCMFGVGICERSGLFRIALQKIVEGSNGSDLKVIVVFCFVGVMADAAGGVGYVIMPVLGASIFAAMGRNPLAGALCGYATVSGAMCANLLLTSMDVTNYSFTEAAARLINPDYTGSPAINWYFAAFSVVVLTAASVLVTIKFVEPGLAARTNMVTVGKTMEILSPEENKGVRNALISILVYALLILAGSIPLDGILRDPETGGLFVAAAPLMKSLPFLIALLFFIPGVTFGFKSGSFKNSTDVVNAMGDCMKDMGSFVALCFVIAQFLKYFEWSNLAIIVAIKGAELLQNSGLPMLAILILFILLCTILNMFIGSASAKYGLIASVFVPMFMLMGYNPALTQMCYRIGDAVTNPITPAFAYFAMLLSLCKQYDKDFGFGTLMASMLPYTVGFFICFVIQLVIWFIFRIPLGPGAGILL